MAKTLQFRRYTTANLASIVPAAGELIVDTNQNTATIGDGTTFAGWYLTTQVQNNANVAIQNGINATQNAGITLASANTIYLSGVQTTQNANIAVALSQVKLAWNLANTAVQNTGNIFANTVNVSTYINFSTTHQGFANTTANTSGNFEFDANAFYLTANTVSGRGVVDAAQFAYYNNTGLILNLPNTSATPLMNASPTLAGGHLYEFEYLIYWAPTTTGVTLNVGWSQSGIQAEISTNLILSGTAPTSNVSYMSVYDYVGVASSGYKQVPGTFNSGNSYVTRIKGFANPSFGTAKYPLSFYVSTGTGYIYNVYAKFTDRGYIGSVPANATYMVGTWS